jgi:DNA-binding transcriptional ArsR family regulator
MREQREATRSAMWALAHPLRLRLFELLADGPATAAALARRTGESRGSTSYHLRVLGSRGVVEEDKTLGTRRERWWRRPEEFVVWPTLPDVEARAITERVTATLVAREEAVRRRFLTQKPNDEWERAAFLGNWFVELTPDEAAALGVRLHGIVDELRRDRPVRDDRAQALLCLSVLPVLPGDRLV